MSNLEKYRSLLTDVDALLLTGRVNRMYAAQYGIAEGVCVITRDEAFYFTDGRYIEAAQNNLEGFTALIVDREHPYTDRINDVIAKYTVKTLGFEEAELTYAEYQRYSAKLHAVLVPYQDKLDAPRAAKEPWELERMRAAQKVTDKVFAELLDVIHAGMTEKELEAELIYRLYKYGAEEPSFDPIVVSGPNTSLPHGVAGQRELAYGDFVTMDFGARVDGYCADMTRTVALGFVTEEMATVYDTVLKAQLAGIAATHAGVLGKDVDAAARAVIDAAGYGKYFVHSYGHGLGIRIHEEPYASPAGEKPLCAGAVVSAEPGIYLPGKFGVRIEDVTVITEDGTEILTRSPKKLIIL